MEWRVQVETLAKGHWRPFLAWTAVGPQELREAWQAVAQLTNRETVRATIRRTGPRGPFAQAAARQGPRAARRAPPPAPGGGAQGQVKAP